MKKISTHLWYDKEAKEAANYYISIFGDGEIKNIVTLENTPSGSVDVVDIRLLDHDFTLISAGPDFKFTPAVSFMVQIADKEKLGMMWDRLTKGGKVMMELGEYPFSEKYGWVQDKYGLSWQLMYVDETEIKQKIIPAMMFVGDNSGKAEEAIGFYSWVFPKSKVSSIMKYAPGEEPEKAGTVKYTSFKLFDQEFVAMDSAYEHGFGFNEAISFVVNCDDQKEIDHYWGKLSAVPEAEQCGWLKDKYGLSWQIVPTAAEKMLKDPDKEKVARVTKAFLSMKKVDIEKLEEAFEGK